MILPVIRVSVVTSASYDTVGLDTTWGIMFQANMESGTGLSFAREKFTTVPISLLDMTERNPQPRWVQDGIVAP